MALATVEEVAEWLGQATPTGAEATRLTLCIETASDKIESLTARQFRQSTDTRTFSPALVNRELLLPDFQTLTLVEVRYRVSGEYEEVAVGSYERHRPAPDRPYDRLLRTDGYYWPSGNDSVRINGTWGWSDPPPEPIHLSAIMASAALFQANKTPGGDTTTADGADLPSLLGYDQRILQSLDVYRNSGAMFG